MFSPEPGRIVYLGHSGRTFSVLHKIILHKYQCLPPPFTVPWPPSVTSLRKMGQWSKVDGISPPYTHTLPDSHTVQGSPPRLQLKTSSSGPNTASPILDRRPTCPLPSLRQNLPFPPFRLSGHCFPTHQWTLLINQSSHLREWELLSLLTLTGNIFFFQRGPLVS